MNLNTTIAELIDYSPEDYASAVSFIAAARSSRAFPADLRTKEESIQFRRTWDERVTKGKPSPS